MIGIAIIEASGIKFGGDFARLDYQKNIISEIIVSNLSKSSIDLPCSKCAFKV
jgi:hypothetical protein